MADDLLLSAKNLSVRFGGVLAVNNVSFDVKRGEVFTLIGPNGAGKTTVFNLISRIYTPTTGTIDFAGPKGMLRLTDQPPHQIAALGIARTFQNIELFEHATVLQNLLIGRHTHRRTGLWSEMFFTQKTRAGRNRGARKGRAGDRVPRPAAPPRLVGGRPALRRAQGGGAGARAVHRTQAAAARRALLRPERGRDRRHGVLDQRTSRTSSASRC